MNQQNNVNTSPQEDDEISILDLALLFVKNAKLILKFMLYFLLIGVIIAIFKPSQYTATSLVVNETLSLDEMNISGGISALRQFGINLGSSGEGLILEAYPQIITSREVLFDVAQDTYYFSDLDTSLRFVDYVNYKDYLFYLKKFTIKLPQTIFRYFFPKKRLLYPDISDAGKNIFFLTEEEYVAIKILGEEYLNVESDIETGLITISVTTFDPNLSASINAAVLDKFRKKMQEIYDKKATENLHFIRERFQEAEKALRKAEETVVKFLEKNSDPNTIALQTELERLKRNVSFKAEVYSELQTQLTQTEIELKRQEPVIRIMERPSPPIEPSVMGRMFMVVAFIFFGLLVGTGGAMFSLFTKNLQQDSENRKKLDEIRQSLPDMNRFRKLLFFKKRT